MCVLCGEAILRVHWTDSRPNAGTRGSALAGESAARGRARDRKERVRALNTILAHHGLGVRDWGPVMYVVSDRKGRSAVVRDLGGVWAEAERLLGRPLDPLDPSLLESIGGAQSGG